MLKTIKLNWKADGIIDSYTIYRSTENIDVNNLPPPLVEGVILKEYTDTYDQDSLVIYYRIASVRGDIRKISSEYIVTLADQPVVISCAGATNEAKVQLNNWDSINYKIEVDGIVVSGINTIVISNVLNDFISAQLDPENYENVYGYGDSSNIQTFANYSNLPRRITITPLPTDGFTLEEIVAKVSYTVSNSNPTLNIDSNGVITMCLKENIVS